MNKPFEVLLSAGAVAILTSDIIRPEHHHYHNHNEMGREMINYVQGVDVYGIGRKSLIPKRTLVGFPTAGITIFEIPAIDALK